MGSILANAYSFTLTTLPGLAIIAALRKEALRKPADRHVEEDEEGQRYQRPQRPEDISLVHAIPPFPAPSRAPRPRRSSYHIRFYRTK